ncbi:MAG: peptidylprolyl isomerase [Clostridiales bacterium]|nr:peptidylprolyl isomerase [Clostridiales bacterium]MDO4350398.1 peptidylprolyl isomerase [Eubacteriales bacterium]MDY4008263.1 peptidylprolyl isomerase [Candidatus Limiplasma sp.]
MRKRVILVFLLVIALVATSSCSLIVKDEEVDKQTTIIEVAGKTITKAEVAEQTEAMLDYQEYVYYLYGMSFDRTSESSISSARSSAIENLIQDAVLSQKTAEMGMDELTADELSEVQESADSAWDTYTSSVKSGYFADTELTGEELDKAIEAKMAELGYPTKDELLDSQKTAKAREKLRSEVVKDVAVTQEELESAYSARVSEAMTNYGNNPSTYGTDVQNGSTIYYVPAGYRFVKNILIKFTDEDNTAINDLQSQLTSKNSELATAESSLSDLGEDASAYDEATAQNRAALTETKERLTGEIAELQTKLDSAKEAAYAAIQPTVDEVLAKLASGEDFDALMEQYGQDTGMQTSPAKENGYPVSSDSTNWVTEFRDAAMALGKVGDVSEAVRSSYGIHILKYVSDAVEGEVGLDSVKDVLEGELLANKQEEAYTAAVEQWVSDANAKVYEDRMN